MASCTSLPYMLTNGNTADASQVMQDFNCVFQSPVFAGLRMAISGDIKYP